MMSSANLLSWSLPSVSPSPSTRASSSPSPQLVLDRGKLTAQNQASPIFDRNLMLCTPSDPDQYAALLRECIQHEALAEGLEVHGCIVKDDLDDDRYLGNILVEMYDKCGALEEARDTFDALKIRNVYSWNNIIAAYSYRRCGAEALNLFYKMLSSVVPNHFTFQIILSACANLETLDEGRSVHDNVVYYGFDNDDVIGTALINVYWKCGSTCDAKRVFIRLQNHNIVSFTVMAAAYVQEGQNEDAIELFRCVRKAGAEMDEFLLSTTLRACTGLGALEDGRWIHTILIDSGFGANNVIVETALLSMYGNCGCLEDAEMVFLKSHGKDVTLFSSLITAYVQLEQCEKALHLFEKMQEEGIRPNEITFASILSACADAAFLMYGKVLYHMIVSHGFELELVVGSAIVNMLGKCGSPKDAHNVLKKMSKRTAVSYNGLITAYVQQGDGKKALDLYHQMISESLKPTEITFMYVLCACGILSSLQEGKSAHISITKCGLESNGKIMKALVSMYGKCGSLKEAFAIFRRMPEPDVLAWNSIIAAYTHNGHYKEALELFEQMQQKGVMPDGVSFISVLSACSHAGLIIEGLHFFFAMGKSYDVEPTMEHYGCVIDLLSRAGQLENAEDFIDKMPVPPDSAAWKAFLAACKFHGDKERGRHAAESVIDSNPQEAPMYVLFADMQ